MLSSMRKLPEGCLSDYRLDQLQAGELAPEIQPSVNAHLSSCARCQARLREIEGEARRFGEEAPAFREVVAPAAISAGAQAAPTPAPIARAPAARPRRRMLSWMAPASGLAAAALAVAILWLRPPGERAGGEGAGLTRTKGDARLGYYVKRGGAVWAGTPGTVLRAGDMVRFTYTTASPRFLTILRVDARGQVEVLYPAGTRAASAPAGRDLALDESIVITGDAGRTRVFGLFCDHPIDLEPLRRAWREQPTAIASPAGCRTDSIVWNESER